MALDISVAAARILADVDTFTDRRPTAVVGRDGRASGEFLEAAVVAGLASAGVDVVLLGVVPTPAVAYLTESLRADLGVMLSASHNAMPDNGIKFFARGGHKLDDAVEDAIEAGIGVQWERPIGAQVGRVRSDVTAVDAYLDFLISTLPNSLDGLHIVVDCANGAASSVAPGLYERAGARVHAIHSRPDGLNINENCGSTHLGDLISVVLERGADVGIAHDGDADRCLAVDSRGNVIDGDHILAILATSMKDSGRLVGSTVVATIMANLGFKIAMRDAGITVVETGVGDRYVLEAMRTEGYVLGGEQSGHVVMTEFANTGDGLLTALHLLSRVVQTKTSLFDLADSLTKFPQVLVNVPGVDRSRAESDPVVTAAVVRATNELGDSGRVLLRPSGTEPVIRVMVEAASHSQALRISDELAAVVLAELALDEA